MVWASWRRGRLSRALRCARCLDAGLSAAAARAVVCGRRPVGAWRARWLLRAAWRAGRDSRACAPGRRACWRCGWPGWRWCRRAHRHQFSAVRAGAGLGGRYCCLFCRTCFGCVHQAQAGALHQPRQELGGRLGRHGRRAGLASSGAGRRACWRRAQFLHAPGQPRLVVSAVPCCSWPP